MQEDEDFVYGDSPSIKPLDPTDSHDTSLPSLQLSSSDCLPHSTNSLQQSSRGSSISFFQNQTTSSSRDSTQVSTPLGNSRSSFFHHQVP